MPRSGQGPQYNWDLQTTVEQVDDLLRDLQTRICKHQTVYLAAMEPGNRKRPDGSSYDFQPVTRDGKPVIVEKEFYGPSWAFDRVPEEGYEATYNILNRATGSVAKFPDLQTALANVMALVFAPPLHIGLKAALTKLASELNRLKAKTIFVGPKTLEEWARQFDIGKRTLETWFEGPEIAGEEVRRKSGRSWTIRQDLVDAWTTEAESNRKQNPRFGDSA